MRELESKYALLLKFKCELCKDWAETGVGLGMGRVSENKRYLNMFIVQDKGAGRGSN